MTRGIILTNGIPADGLVYHMALVFEESCRYVRDFKLMPVHTTKEVIKTKYSELSVNPIPKKVVNVTDTMIFGEMISWNDRDASGAMINVVREYTRIHSDYESRIALGETQLKLQGVMSKNRKVLWMLDIWPDLEIPHHLRNSAHPNVVVEAWVTVRLMPNQCLRYELGSFAGISPTLQHTVRQAMWNEAHEGNMRAVSDPLVAPRKDLEFVAPLSSELTGMKGIVVSEKQILPVDPKHRDVCFHLVVISEDRVLPPIGTYVTFKADHLEYLNVYGINGVFKNHAQNRLPVSQEGNLKTTIRFQEGLPGFYFSEKLGIYVDDPRNILESWLLSRYVGSTLQVGITAGEPSDKGVPRYLIREITDAKAKKVHEFRESGMMKLENEVAVLVDKFRTLHFPRFPKTNIRVPKSISDHPIGTVFRISAICEKKWRVTHIAIDENTPPIATRSTVDPTTDELQTWFFVPEARGSKQMPVYLVSSMFGLIHPLKAWKVRLRPEQHVERNFWVTLNDCSPGDILLPPAKFKYAGSGDQFSVNKTEILADEEMDEEVSELHPRQALNDAHIPITVRAISDEEFKRRMESEGDHIINLVQSLEKDADFIKNPCAVIESQCVDHMKGCRICNPDRKLQPVRKPKMPCFFPEYLSFALRMRPEICGYLSKTDILTAVALRRYEMD